MTLWGELLAVNNLQAAKFFFDHLKEVASPRGEREIDETLYIATVLADYTQFASGDDLSSPTFVFEILKELAFRGESILDYPNSNVVLEHCGARILFLNGFLREGMKYRYNVKRYDDLGKSFYQQAGRYSISPRKQELFTSLADNFCLWTSHLQKVRRNLVNLPYLLPRG